MMIERRNVLLCRCNVRGHTQEKSEKRARWGVFGQCTNYTDLSETHKIQTKTRLRIVL